jgi:hypothetical protein
MHLLVEQVGTYYYTGLARLGAVTLPNDPATVYWFHVDPKLTWPIWRRLGGYDGWRVTINGEDLNIVNEQGLYALLNRVSSLSQILVVATRYEEDSFALFINGECGVVNYTSPSGELFASSEENFSGDPFDEIDFHFPASQSLEFSKALVISRTRALQEFASHIRHGHPANLKRWAPPSLEQGY